ncbi:MAG: hypothetical protein ACKVQK_18570 [Burkholderiales bacterium]
MQAPISTMTRTAALFLGSVPLKDAQSVFSALAGLPLGTLSRFPDGETGARGNWIGWQRAVFAAVPAFHPLAERERVYQLYPPFTLREGADANDVSFGPLGFAREACNSYNIFAGKKDRGEIPPGARFQVALPTAWAPVYSFVAARWQAAIHGRYEQAMLTELEQILASIPNEELTIQWDVATEMSWWEGVYPAPFANSTRAELESAIVQSIARLLNVVPKGVELGLHLCYGSMNNRHWKEPTDTANLVAVANVLAAACVRRIDYLHLPVPIGRDDATYFAPLAALKEQACTQLYLGLLHAEDGIEGALRRIRSARQFSKIFGIACECGLGRYPAEEIADLLTLHGKVAHAMQNER